jgi:hypothetical protein
MKSPLAAKNKNEKSKQSDSRMSGFTCFSSYSHDSFSFFPVLLDLSRLPWIITFNH